MVKRWFFSSQGQMHGPLEPEDIKARAALGQILPDDPIWPEGGDPKDAIPAEQAIDFPALAKPPALPPTPAPAIPDWLSELPPEAARPQTPAPASSAALAAPGGLPDWLDDVRAQEPPSRPPVQEEQSPPSPEDSSVEISLDTSAPEEPQELTIEAAAAAELAEQAEQTAKPSASMAAMEETWRRVRVALERWIDLDVNAGLLMTAD